MYWSSTSAPSALAGPKRPQDKVLLSDMKRQFHHDLADTYGAEGGPQSIGLRWPVTPTRSVTGHGHRGDYELYKHE